MPKYKDFEVFARDLLLFGTNKPIHGCDIGDMEPTTFMSRADKVVEIFGEVHCSKIERILKKSLIKEFGTDEEFMRFTIPKCLNLIDDEKYFYSLMLVAAFIIELTNTLYQDMICFRFIQTGYKCFAAVFSRRFKAGFEAHGGFKGLDKYFRSVVKCYYESEMYSIDIMLLNGEDRDATLKVAHLIRNCDDGFDKDFLLNDYELSMAEDAEATRKEWFDETIVEKNDSPLEMECNMKSQGANMKVMFVYDKSKCTCFVCKYCNRNDATGVLEDRQFPIPDEEERIDSDIETSESEAYSEKIFYQMGFKCLSLEQPDEFDRMMSSHLCDWCGTQCYQYSKYMTRKHVGLALRDERPKWVKSLSYFFWKVKRKIGKVV